MTEVVEPNFGQPGFGHQGVELFADRAVLERRSDPGREDMIGISPSRPRGLGNDERRVQGSALFNSGQREGGVRARHPCACDH